MRNLVLQHTLLASLLFCFPVFGQAPAPAFANRFGGSGSDYSRSIRTYANGSSILIGEFLGSVTLAGVTYNSQGESDAFICKINADGEVQWAKILAGPGVDYLTQVALDGQGNVAVVGEFTQSASFGGTAVPHSSGKDALVARISESGNLLWVKTAGNAALADYNEVETDAEGNIYAFGTFTETLTVGAITLEAGGSGTNPDACLVKYNNEGNVVWAKRFGSGASEEALGIYVSPQGICTLTGTFLGSTVFGTTTHTSNGSSDIFLVQLNAQGDPVWSRSYGGTGTDNSFALTGDAQGNLFLSGCFMQTFTIGSTSLTSNGLWDVFTAKILPDGNPGWLVGFGSSQNDRCNDVRLDASGNVYMFGWFQGEMIVGSSTHPFLGGYDVFLIKLQPDGVPIWSTSFGGSTIDVGAGMDLDAAGNLYLAGDFWSTDFSIGGLNLSPVSGNDIFHIRLGSLPTRVEGEIGQISPLFGYSILGQRELGTHQSGRLQLYSVSGQLIAEHLLEAGQPLRLTNESRIVFYRFQHIGGVESGKWSW